MPNAAGTGADAVASATCLPDLLLAHAALRPDAVAVEHGDERVSFRELVERATRLGGHLRGLGVGADRCVGLYVEPSIDLVVAAWGILLAGGAYLPLSPEYPEDRIRYMLDDNGADVIVTQPRLRARLAEQAPRVSWIVQPDDADGHVSGAAPTTDPGSLAYVIYTSGSTGKPKGVMIEHRSIVNQLRWLAGEGYLGPDRVILQKTPMSFDAAQWEILAPACGARVVVGRPGIYRDPDGLIETIQRRRVTTLQCVPTLLQALVDDEAFAACTSLAQVFSGGEALTRALATETLAALPDIELVNLYGPTECTINSSAQRVDRATVADGPATIAIGAPVANTVYHVLGPDGARLGVGEQGELYVGGVQLARGYFGRPELTTERFVPNPFADEDGSPVLYRTGDLAHWNADGSVQYAGRTDSQVKLRGFRVELDEIRLGIEGHDWVKNAAVVVSDDDRTGLQNLVAFVELNPKEAALMDQGNHGAHHQSKDSKLQLRAQLSNAGCRDDDELAGRPVVELPGREPTEEQTRLVFARKTYRHYEGGEVTAADIVTLLSRRPRGSAPREPGELTLDEFGGILRYFGQFHSDDRLLPKYGYASPGSLYATQLYWELEGLAGLAPGYYYYHPVDHTLVLVRALPALGETRVRAHFVGKRRAIEPVYRNNIQEVLEIETGHLVGLFEEVLPAHGLDMTAVEGAHASVAELDCVAEDYYLGAFELIPHGAPKHGVGVDVYVQAHPDRVAGLPAGPYRYHDGEFDRISDELIQRKHVIAINQQVYERASFGVTIVSRREHDDWRAYVDLGRKLQHLQLNDAGLGFMSSGYSSKSGNDLPSARRIADILAARGERAGPSYFCVGGRVSEEQILARGMKEDTVHMRGPAEMIRDDLGTFLPDYMLPNRVIVLDRLPLTVNGKIDVKALAASPEARQAAADRPFVAPRTYAERVITEIWATLMKRAETSEVSVVDDFFAAGGNSLIAVSLVNRVNREFGSTLPLQTVFQAPTIEQLAARVDGNTVAAAASRLVPLRPAGSARPVFCWPGLGGYPMNLRLLATTMGGTRPFLGVQAHGINAGEEPHPTIERMAAADVELIRARQPHGPYTLWGYSFGARVAFETAWQLEQAGETVDTLFLIAPGSPAVRGGVVKREMSFANPTYVTILHSVFAGSITDPALPECLAAATDERSFARFVAARHPGLDPELIARIVRIVGLTYEFEYNFEELSRRTIAAPVTIFKATGDDYSFIEGASGWSAAEPAVVELVADHYELLKAGGIDELVAELRRRLPGAAQQSTEQREAA